MSDNDMFNQEDLKTPVVDETSTSNVVEESSDVKKSEKREPPKKDKKVSGKESFSKVRAIVGVLLIIAAIITGIILVPVMSGQKTSYSILYAKVDVPAGVQINDENIGVYFGNFVTSDKTLASVGIPSNKAAAILKGAYTKRQIFSGKYPATSDFSKINTLYSDAVPEGFQLVAINIQSMQSNIGYMPKTGDIIQFYKMVTYENNDDIYFDAANIHVPTGHSSGSRAEVYDYLQYVEIFASIDGDRNDASKGGAPVVYVVKCRPGVQVQQLIEAAQSGNYYWTLVSSGDKGHAEALLKLQDDIIESGINGAGREEVLFNLDDLTLNGFTPRANSTVRFSAAIKNGETTALENPGLLKYVTVLNVYDQNKVNMNLESGVNANRTATYVGLNLTKEQADLLTKLIADGQVFMKEVKESQDKIVSGFDAVNDLLWGERAQAIMQQAGSPDVSNPEDKKDAA